MSKCGSEEIGVWNYARHFKSAFVTMKGVECSSHYHYQAKTSTDQYLFNERRFLTMANGTSPNGTSFVCLEKKLLDFIVQLRGRGINRCLREDVTCAICDRVFDEDALFAVHLGQHHKCSLAKYLQLDLKYAEAPRVFWCFLCSEPVTTTPSEGGRGAHIEEVHGTTEEIFNHMTYCYEGDSLRKVHRKRKNLQKIAQPPRKSARGAGKTLGGKKPKIPQECVIVE